QAGKAHNQPMLRPFRKEVNRYRSELQPILERRDDHFAVIEGHEKTSHYLHTGSVVSHREPLREMLCAQLDEMLLPVGIEPPRPLQVARKMTLGNEVGECGLKR